jgi:pilus assembly protein CpaE
LLTSIVISPKADRNGELSAILKDLAHVRILRSFDKQPSEQELERFLQVAGPSIIFLGIEEDQGATLRLAAAIDRAETGAQVVVLSNVDDQWVLIESMKAGIREFLTLPLKPDRVNEAMCRIIEVLERKPLAFKSTDAVFSFLPAKPGDGASTVALNVCAAIARRSDGETLLADFDLNLGMVSFLLKITNGHSVLDALNMADRMDSGIWDNLVLQRDKMDVLCSGRLEPRNEVDLSPADKLLHFARRCYSTICLDLSGNMEPFSMGLLGQSREIFIVCTPDIPSLHFARSKAQFLRESGFGDHTSVVLNRTGLNRHFSTGEIEKLVGLPVRFSLPNDPKCVSSAMADGTSVNPKSGLGGQFGRFADSMVQTDAGPAPATRKRRFIEYFALVPSSR